MKKETKKVSNGDGDEQEEDEKIVRRIDGQDWHRRTHVHGKLKMSA